MNREDRFLTGRATQRRRIALLALLAGAGERGLSRDKILSYLWPEHDTDRARHALSQVLYAIRKDFGQDCIAAGVDELRLNPSAIRADITDYKLAVSTGDLRMAASLYAGPFLDGFFVADAPEFEQWAERERQELQASASRVFAQLGSDELAVGNFAEALPWLRRCVVLEPFNARVILDLMDAYETSGDRTMAMRCGQTHVNLARTELGIEADARITQRLLLLANGDSTLEVDPSLPDVRHSPPMARDVSVRGEGIGDSAAPEASNSASTMTSSVRHRPWHRVAPLVLALALLLVYGVRWYLGRQQAVQVLVLGAAEGPDTSLNHAVREALEAELVSMSSIRIMSRAAVDEGLALMNRAPGTPLTEELAVEMAERRGGSFAIAMSVLPIGTGIEVSARLIDVRSPDESPVMVRERAEVPEALISAVGRLAATLGTTVGSRSRRGLPDSLPAVSTSSLPALRTYAAARLALQNGDRWSALSHGLAAIQQDSEFAMAHFLVGDVAWFLDRQSVSDAHLTAAFRLSERLPLRERLLVRARYMQIVRDETDSALAYWSQLHAAFPREALAYEGRAWTNRARGETEDAYRAADSALQLDPSARVPNQNNKLSALLSGVPDTMRALALADSLGDWARVQARLVAALERRDWDAALRSVDGTYPPMPRCGSYWAAPLRQSIFIAANRVADAARELDVVLCWSQGPGGWPLAQMYIPNALLLQGRAEVMSAATRKRGVSYAQRALDFVDSADISIPAVARLAERAADIGARGRDRATIERARRIVQQRDHGRGFPSYRLALLSIDAALAFYEGDMPRAANLAKLSRQRTFFGRGTEIAWLLEADARAAIGQRAIADSLFRDSRAPAAFLVSSARER